MIHRQRGRLCGVGHALSSSLLTILLSDVGIVVICELSAFFIRHDFTLGSVFEFREIPESYEVQNNVLSIAFMNGSARDLYL